MWTVANTLRPSAGVTGCSGWPSSELPRHINTCGQQPLHYDRQRSPFQSITQITRYASNYSDYSPCQSITQINRHASPLLRLLPLPVITQITRHASPLLRLLAMPVHYSDYSPCQSITQITLHASNYSDYSACCNSLVHFKNLLGSIVCISIGSLNLIWFIVTHVICLFVTHVPVSKQYRCWNKIYLLISLFIYLFIRSNSAAFTQMPLAFISDYFCRDNYFFVNY